MRNLAQILPQTQITHLNLADNRIGNEPFVLLIQCLPISMIISFNLRGNEIGTNFQLVNSNHEKDQ